MLLKFVAPTLVVITLYVPQPVLAITLGQSTSALEAQLKKTPSHLVVREKLGGLYYERKRYEKVIEVFAPYSNELSEDAILKLADAYQLTHDNLNQIRVLQSLVDKNPDRFRPHYLIGCAYKTASKYDDAATHLRRSIELAPKHRPSYDALLEVFTTNKQNYESRLLIQDMIRVFGPKKDFQNRMCKLYADDGFLNEALENCKKAVSMDTETPDNHIYLAQTYYNMGNRPAAEKIFQTAARRYGKSEFVQYAAGEYYLNEKQYSIAVRYLQQAVLVNPSSQRALITLALAEFESKDYKAALDHFALSCRLDKSSETKTILKNSASKLRMNKLDSQASEYDKRAELCQPSSK